MDSTDNKGRPWWLEPKIILTILFLCIAATFILPIVLTSFSWVNFSETGQIGDTIGGITSPIFGIVGAYLVYAAFHEQVEANTKLMEYTRMGLENANYDEISRSLDRLDDRSDDIREVVRKVSSDWEGTVHYVDYLVTTFDDLSHRIRNLPNADKRASEIESLQLRLCLIFSARYLYHLNGLPQVLRNWVHSMEQAGTKLPEAIESANRIQDRISEAERKYKIDHRVPLPSSIEQSR